MNLNLRDASVIERCDDNLLLLRQQHVKIVTISKVLESLSRVLHSKLGDSWRTEDIVVDRLIQLGLSQRNEERQKMETEETYIRAPAAGTAVISQTG
jgi:hypothetical protein